MPPSAKFAKPIYSGGHYVIPATDGWVSVFSAVGNYRRTVIKVGRTGKQIAQYQLPVGEMFGMSFAPLSAGGFVAGVGKGNEPALGTIEKVQIFSPDFSSQISIPVICNADCNRMKLATINDVIVFADFEGIKFYSAKGELLHRKLLEDGKIVRGIHVQGDKIVINVDGDAIIFSVSSTHIERKP